MKSTKSIELTAAEARVCLKWYNFINKNVPQLLDPWDHDVGVKLRKQVSSAEAHPAAPKKKTLSPTKVFAWLLANNYKMNDVCDWESPDDRPDFLSAMWQLCGTTTLGGFHWLPEWFEEGE